MDFKARVLIIVGFVALFIIAFVFFLDSSNFSTGHVLLNEESSMSSFISCLNEKGVFLYGFSSHPQVKAQLDLFGENSLDLKVIDCHFNPEECNGVIVYPSWNIEGRIVSGGLSSGMLSDLSGCRL